MYCTKCGARISDIAEFCTNCGEKVNGKHESDMPPVSAKCVCPECGAKNDLNAGECIQCEKVIERSRLTFTCPDCGSIMEKGYTVCPVCNFDFRTGRKGVRERFIYRPLSFEGNDPAYSYYGKARRTVNPAPIIICVLVVLFILIFVSCKLFFENRAAQDLYNMAYTAVYDTDMTYISPRTEQIVNSAYDQAQSVFVLNSTKDRIEELKQISDDYIELAEAEDLMESAPFDSILSIQEKVNNIVSLDVKNSARYKAIKPRMENVKFQASNRTWAENKLEELRNNGSETIQSWSRIYLINYYIGAVYFVNMYNEVELEIRLEDYEGNSHYLRLPYNFDESSNWDQHIGELSQKLKSGKRCVMAAITAVDYSDYERVFSYSYRFE